MAATHKTRLSLAAVLAALAHRPDDDDDDRPPVKAAPQPDEVATAEQLDALAAELGLGDRVRFMGSLPDVRAVLHAADGYVMSSLREGSSISALEAMASALPAAYRPAGDAGFICPSSGGVANVWVTAAGVLTIASGANGWVYLDGIRYRGA